MNYKRVRTGRSAGFTLLEVMIALLVLAIGLLGIAALQLSGLKATHSAYQRTVASIIAKDAAERLWIRLADDGVVNEADRIAVQTAWLSNWQTHTANDPDATVVTLANMNGTITRQNADGTLISVDQNDTRFSINVTWNEERFEGGGESFTYVIRLIPESP